MSQIFEPIVVEQTYDASTKRVWDAITKLDQMRHWYFENIPAFEPEVGFKTQFNIRSQTRDFMHMWEVTKVEPFKLITYDWSYEGYAGRAFVEFQLFPKGSSTKLRLTNHVVDRFPKEIPEFTRESCQGGWEFFLQQRLKEYLEKESHLKEEGACE